MGATRLSIMTLYAECRLCFAVMPSDGMSSDVMLSDVILSFVYDVLLF